MSAKTKEEAQRYFTENLGLVSNDYMAMHLDIANMVNKEVEAVYDIFGNLNAGGRLKGFQITARLLPGEAARYSPTSKEIFLRKEDVMYVTSMVKLGADAQTNLDIGFWSTNKPEHAVRHELGHAVWYLL
ncbi:hypothetical protein, partial [Treponema sp. R8-4-B8]